VSLRYEVSPASGALRQGEILKDVWEYRAEMPAAVLKDDQSVSFRPYHHAFVIVMTAECDLFHDYRIRYEPTADEADKGESHPRLLQHLFLCDLFEQEEIRPLMAGSDIFRRAKRNQEERFHCLPEADIGDPVTTHLPELFMDFHRTIGIHPFAIYEGVTQRDISRIAVVPPVYVHDLMHRYFGFLSRVGLPD